MARSLKDHPFYERLRSVSLDKAAGFVADVPVAAADKPTRAKMFREFGRLVVGKDKERRKHGFNGDPGGEIARGLEQAYLAGRQSAGASQESGNPDLTVPAEEVTRVLSGAMHALRSYQHGNSAPDLAAGIADACEALLARLGQAEGGGALRDTAEAIAGLQALHAALALAGFVQGGSSK
ncbi:hypothetical protein [Xanthobacter flavus]|uniref:hypothetical protein n=1 Tax=Xanthobacter flavus TaxID=281 RepID=UPI0037281B7E